MLKRIVGMLNASTFRWSVFHCGSRVSTHGTGETVKTPSICKEWKCVLVGVDACEVCFVCCVMNITGVEVNWVRQECDYYGEQHILLSLELLFLDLYHGVEHFQAAQNAHVRCTFDPGFREKENHQTETQRKMCLLRARSGRSRPEKLLMLRKLITDDVQKHRRCFEHRLWSISRSSETFPVGFCLGAHAITKFFFESRVP